MLTTITNYLHNLTILKLQADAFLLLDFLHEFGPHPKSLSDLREGAFVQEFY